MQVAHHEIQVTNALLLIIATDLGDHSVKPIVQQHASEDLNMIAMVGTSDQPCGLVKGS